MEGANRTRIDMGKSFKKRKIFGNCGGSEKQDKRLCNRKLRRIVKDKLKHGDDEVILPVVDEVMNQWSMQKDGKHYWPDAEEKDMRK